MTYFPKIDSLRFVAACMVLVSHWLFYFPVIRGLNLGEMGVDLFFTISGFLITLQLMNFKEKAVENRLGNGHVLKEFYLRRSLRIFPLYYLIVILSTLFNEGEIREAFLYNLTFTTNFYIIGVEHWPSVFSHFWSLAVEEHFYLFWPFIILFLGNRSLPYVTCGLILLTFLAKWYMTGHGAGYFFLHVHTMSCIDLIMYGCLLAWLYKNRYNTIKEIFEFSGFLFFSVALIISAITYRYYFMQTQLDYVVLRSLTGIAFAFLVGALVFNKTSGRWSLFDKKWMVVGGQLSFGIYLLHNFVPGLLLGMKDLKLHWSLEFLAYFLFTLVVSAVLHWVIELPLRRLGKLKFSSVLLKD